MTVAELISELQKLDSELPVYFSDSRYANVEVTIIEIDDECVLLV